jgi:hypothetical protein
MSAASLSRLVFSRLVFSLASLLLVGLASPGVAQAQAIDGHQRLTEEYWGSDKLSQRAAGRQYYLDGRWGGVAGDFVGLFPQLPGRFLIVPDGQLKESLISGELPVDDGVIRLERRLSRVRVFGTARADGRGCLLDVTRIVKIPDDLQRFRDELRQAGRDPDAIAALIERVRQAAETYDDDEVGALAHQFGLQLLDLRVELLAPDDFAGALALADDLVAERPQQAVRLLAHVEANGSGFHQQVAGRKLADLGAIQSGDTWILLNAFKRSEGFIQRNGRWVRREHAEFDDQIQAEIDLQTGQVQLIRDNPVRHMQSAERGQVVRGQTMPEVRRAAGLPEFTEHRPGAHPQTQTDTTWTQWLMADGRRVYFVGGEVFATLSGRQGLPDR